MCSTKLYNFKTITNIITVLTVVTCLNMTEYKAICWSSMFLYSKKQLSLSLPNTLGFQISWTKLNTLEISKLNLEETRRRQITYIKMISEKFGRKVIKILDLIGIQTRIAFIKGKVRSRLTLKDSLNKKFSSCLVYKFMCPGNLESQYI